jgi:hypothetical protein
MCDVEEVVRLSSAGLLREDALVRTAVLLSEGLCDARNS